MKTLNLNGSWQFRNNKDREWLTGQVPGSLISDLYRLQYIENPYYRDNIEEIQKIFAENYEYRKIFDINQEDLRNENAELYFNGIDTITEIYFNKQLIGKTSNMHRIYRYDIKEFLKVGKNEIRVVFHSPTNYILQKDREKSNYGIPMATSGYTYLRKAHYMFGWDWGPTLPDCGIWREVSLQFYSSRWKDINIRQKHIEDSVKLNFDLVAENSGSDLLEYELTIKNPKNEFVKFTGEIVGEKSVEVTIEDPMLWWPNGLGEQYLYEVLCELKIKDKGFVIDSKEMKIGLRKLTVNTQPDQWGDKFAFRINGIDIFSMGADYIPEDNILDWTSKDRTENLIKDCIKAHFNTIRVWGGGIYPDNYFYDLCDKYGLIVWQDLMFACGKYELSDEGFIDNCIGEIKDNITRIRHHACIGLICGNNEIEMFFEDGRIENNEDYKSEYIDFFENNIKAVINNLTDIFYWPSSPSSGGNFFETNGENRGDGHNWDVWHGNKPFTSYRNTHYRFMSEFGFESLPNMETIQQFTEQEDRNLFSYIMEYHQKDPSGNTRIFNYLSKNFKYPKDFSSLIYISQVLQAEAVRYGVEHWRRNRGRCMGTLYWQLNDCWPTVSWSSLDYYGRWKALHYAAKRFYSPILLSVAEDESKVDVYITNDSLKDWEGMINWSFLRKNGEVIESGSFNAHVDQLSSSFQFTKKLPPNFNYRETFFYYELLAKDMFISSGTVLFTPTKYFNFENAMIEVKVIEEEQDYVIELKSDTFAKFVELKLEDKNVCFSDNFFDLSPTHEYKVYINKEENKELKSIRYIQEHLQVRSYCDSY